VSIATGPRKVSLALHVPAPLGVTSTADRILKYFATHGSDPKDRRSVELPVRKMAAIWGVTPSAVSQAAKKLEHEQRIERVEPAVVGVHGGRYVLLKPLKAPPLVKRLFYMTDIMYWWARRYHGYVDLELLAKALGVKRPGMQRALKLLRRGGVLSCRRIGRRWQHVMLHALRPYREDMPGRLAKRLWNSEETFPESFFEHLKRVHDQLNGPRPPSPPTPPSPLKALTTKALTTQLNDKAVLGVHEGDQHLDRPSAFEILDCVFEIHRAERRLDPCAELSSEPWRGGALLPNPKATARLRGLMSMAEKKNTALQAQIRANIKSAGQRTQTNMPTVQDDRKTRTLYRVGTAKMRVMLEAFQQRQPDYSLSAADNEAVRSPRIGWQCEAWVQAYLAGGDYDPYELEFDEETDPRFQRWSAGIKWLSENEGAWEQFWNIVKMETSDITGELFADVQLRTIETFVWSSGDQLAEEIGHRTGCDAWLAAARMLGEAIYRPMHQDLRAQQDKDLAPDERQWVTLFAIGLANRHSSLLSGPQRSAVLLTLAAIRYEGAWGLSAEMLQRLGIEGDYEAMKEEGLALLQKYRDGQRDEVNPGGPDPLFAANLDMEAVRQTYGASGDGGGLTLVDFSIDPASTTVGCRFSSGYYEALRLSAERDGDEEAEECLMGKIAILQRAEQGESVTMDDCTILAQRVRKYQEEPPPEMEWALCLKGTGREPTSTQTG